LISEFYFQGIREYAAAQGSIREYAAAQGSIREYAAAQGRQKKWWQFWKRESESIQRPASQPRHPTFAGAARLATPKACPKSTPSVRTVYCPNCQKQVVWVEHLKGKQVSCYLCGKAFKMPE
jgi:hypothetical protein